MNPAAQQSFLALLDYLGDRSDLEALILLRRALDQLKPPPEAVPRREARRSS